MSTDLNLAMMRTRAYKSGLFIVFTHPRKALITGARGNIRQNNENEDDRFAVTAVELSKVAAARCPDHPSHLRDRWADVYEL